MKIIFAACIALSTLIGQVSVARDVYVKGYTKSNGTYVQPHMRTAPDSNPYNNYSTQGNVNPYTGKSGTVDPYNQYGSGSNSNSYNSWDDK